MKNSREGRQRRSWCNTDGFQTHQAFWKVIGIVIVWNNQTFQAATEAAEEQRRWEREEKRREAGERRKEEKRRGKEVRAVSAF